MTYSDRQGSKSLLLLDSFTSLFPKAAAIIRRSTQSLELIRQSEQCGITFGGYPHDGPDRGAGGRAYTNGNAVYIPQGSDPILEVGDFLFELANGVQSDHLADTNEKAAQGSITSGEYAQQLMQHELNSAMRVAAIWLELKHSAESIGSSPFDYDGYFFLPEYMAVTRGKLSMEELVEACLDRKYATGALKGKSQREYYLELYHKVATRTRR